MTTRPTYWGPKPILVIAIDVGTAFSGASYAFLKTGEVPKIKAVTKFEGQENKQGHSKVPTVLFYPDNDGPVVCGAVAQKLRSRKGIRTKWFKLKLRPASMNINAPNVHLPPGRDVVDVFGDFLKYMYDCVRTQFLTERVDGKDLWDSLSRTTQFVLSHPNGWGSHQQGRMRDAAIRGGLVPDTLEGRERIEFVTEGEASFQWCIDEGLTGAALREGTNIVVADLGGGTIDVSSFVVKTPKPLLLQEQMTSECALEGSIIVTDRFVESARRNLQGTPYSEEGYIEALREDFDTGAKCHFRSCEERGEAVYEVRIGGYGDNFEDENGLCSIESGQLNVNREDIAAAFEPSLVATVDAIRKHTAGRRDTVGLHVFLVGGFAASPWMFSETKRRLRANGITREVQRADDQTAKAVAHGGVAFYLDRNVTHRAMRYTYGVSLRPHFNQSNPEHQARSHMSEEEPFSGKKYLDGGFFPLVKKGQVIKIDSEYRKSVQSWARRAPEMHTWVQSIKRYNGTRDNVTFVDMDPFAFDEIGRFRCEIPASAMTPRRGQYGTYYVVDYNVVITLGTVEIKAYVEWEENGQEKRTPAKSMWEDYY